MLLGAKQSVAVRPAATPSRAAVRVHATPRWSDAVKAGFLSAAVAAALLLSPSSVQASTLADEAVERELAIASQKTQLEYLLAQQENARRAALLAQRKAVEQQVTTVETALQQKLTQQRASVLAAQQGGDKNLAETFKANTAQLEEKTVQVQKAAAQLESKLDRAEMLQKAKAISERQQVQKAAQDATDDINEALDRWLESVSSLK